MISHNRSFQNNEVGGKGSSVPEEASSPNRKGLASSEWWRCGASGGCALTVGFHPGLVRVWYRVQRPVPGWSPVCTVTPCTVRPAHPVLLYSDPPHQHVTHTTHHGWEALTDTDQDSNQTTVAAKSHHTGELIRAEAT